MGDPTLSEGQGIPAAEDVNETPETTEEATQTEEVAGQDQD